MKKESEKEKMSQKVSLNQQVCRNFSFRKMSHSTIESFDKRIIRQVNHSTSESFDKWVIRTLNCRDLSRTVNPSSAEREVEQVRSPGQVHCFSTQGFEYVSTLLQTADGGHTGRWSWVGTPDGRRILGLILLIELDSWRRERSVKMRDVIFFALLEISQFLKSRLSNSVV